MFILLQLLIQLLGFSLLSLSMPRHYSDVFIAAEQLKKKTQRLFRWGGFSLIVLATLLGINHWGVALGLVYVVATATLVATALAMLLTVLAKKSTR